MVSKNVNKVQKHIAKKKGKNAPLHENSRDSRRLARAGAREDKLHRLSSGRAKLNTPYLDRVAHFQTWLESRQDNAGEAQSLVPSATCSVDEIQTQISLFIARSDPELNSLSSARRPGRPTSTREERLSQRRTTESAEHASGFWLPDLRDADVVAKLREWNGDWVALAALGSFCRVDTKGEVRESLFPPRGGS